MGFDGNRIDPVRFNSSAIYRGAGVVVTIGPVMDWGRLSVLCWSACGFSPRRAWSRC